MISILRPSTPPLALISSAASWAACGIEAPAIACASAMTPILIGSAASAGPEAASTRPRAVAPSSERKNGVRYVDVMTFLSMSSRPGRPSTSPGYYFWPCGLEVIVAALVFPASETATTCFGGTTSISPWEVQNRRSPFARQATLMGRAKNIGACRSQYFPCLFKGLGGWLIACCSARKRRQAGTDETKD